jgi:hypothetical protein
VRASCTGGRHAEQPSSPTITSLASLSLIPLAEPLLGIPRRLVAAPSRRLMLARPCVPTVLRLVPHALPRHSLTAP